MKILEASGFTLTEVSIFYELKCIDPELTDRECTLLTALISIANLKIREYIHPNTLAHTMIEYYKSCNKSLHEFVQIYDRITYTDMVYEQYYD